MDQRLNKRREASKLRSARHRAGQKREWEDLRKEAQELRPRVVVSEQKLEMVLIEHGPSNLVLSICECCDNVLNK